MTKVFGRFADWVDSHGKDAGDNMLVGATCGGLAGGVLAALAGLTLMSGALLGVGLVVGLAHLFFIVAVF